MSNGFIGEITKLQENFNKQVDKEQYTIKDLEEIKKTLQDFITEVETTMILVCL